MNLRRARADLLAFCHGFGRGWRRTKLEAVDRPPLVPDVEIDELDAQGLAELPDWLIASLWVEAQAQAGAHFVELERRPVEHTPDLVDVPRLKARPRCRVIYRFPVALLRLEAKRRGLA